MGRMGWLVGIEPTYVGITIRCVNRFAIATIRSRESVVYSNFRRCQPEKQGYSKKLKALPALAQAECLNMTRWGDGKLDHVLPTPLVPIFGNADIKIQPAVDC